MSARTFNLEIRNEATHAEILISGPIGGSFWDDSGMTEKAFLDALKTIPEDRPIDVWINSEGGSVQAGLGMYSALRRRKNTTAHIDGYAVSIASVIPLACERVISPKSSIWMIHEPWMVAQGNAEDMLKAAEVLEKHGETLAGIYEAETGMSAEEVRKKMKAETWFRGDEAVAMGFADEATDSTVALNSFDATRFKNCPNDILKTICAPAGAAHQKANLADTARTAPAHSISPSPVASGELPKTEPAATTAKKETTQMSDSVTPVAADNAAILAKIEAIENKLNAPAPAPASIENLGNPALEKYNRMEPGAARAAFRVANHAILSRERSKIQNSNTIDSALIPDYLSDALITIVGSKLAPLSAYSLGVSLNPVAPRQTVQVTLASAGSSTLTNATNFEQGNGTLAGQPVTVDQLSQPFHLTNAEIGQGIMIQKLAQVNANALADSISDIVTALMVNANYGAATAVGAASAFTPTGGKLSIIYGLAKNYSRKNLLMDGGHLGYLIPTNREAFKIGEEGSFGFDLIAEQNRWTNAETNAVGFVCSPDAICVATGVPLNLPSSEFLSQNTITLKNGLSVVLSSWYSRGSRQVWMCYDTMFGAGVGDATAGEILVTS